MLWVRGLRYAPWQAGEHDDDTNRPLKGTIRGKTIELEREPGLPDGQIVTVTLRPSPLPEGLLQAFGACADEADEVDRFVEEVYRDRGRDRPEPAP